MRHKRIAVALLSLLSMIGRPLLDQTTFADPPTATTLAASSPSMTNATINGSVNPNGLNTTVYFEYGLTTQYGKFGPITQLPAANATLAMPGLMIDSVTGPVGNSWINIGGPDFSSTIVSSADGTGLAVGDGRSIWTSTNSGGSWNQATPPTTNYWESFALSADGKQLAAAAGYQSHEAPNSLIYLDGGIWTSTNDGVKWAQTSAPTTNWHAIASSVDGTHLAAAIGFFYYFPPLDPLWIYGGIWTSSNSGVTWTQTTAPFAVWYTIVSSIYGDHLSVLGDFGVWISSNGGDTWTMADTNFRCLAMSADGIRQAALDPAGDIWISGDGGGTWTQTSSPVSFPVSIASSWDGTRLAVVDSLEGIFTSSDRGKTWTNITPPFSRWVSIAFSADGSQLVALNSDGRIYSSRGAVIALAPGTTYHYQLVGINSSGTGLGGDQTFTTSPGAAVATTLSADQVASTHATLNGSLTTGGFTTAAWFNYGFTTNYGSFTTPIQLGGTNTPLAVSNWIGGLSPETTYHYQLVVSNSSATSLGVDQTFATSLHEPVPFSLSNPSRLYFQVFQLSFTNQSGVNFTVLGTTNLAIPFTNWTVMGPAVESPVGSGNYQYYDNQNTKASTRYYRVRSP